MKQRFLLLVLAVWLLTAGAALAQESGDIEPWLCPQEVLDLSNKTLNILNWATYIAEDTIPNFEAACGARVTLDFFASNEELLSRLRAGNPGFDIAVPSEYAVDQMLAEGLLLPLNKQHIPNLANVAPELLGPEFDPDNDYSIPYQWGTVGIGYEVNAVRRVMGDDFEFTSWMQLLDYPERRVGWIEDSRSVIGIGLLLLGYDPNSEDADEIREATDLLVQKGRHNVLRIAADDGQELLARGEVDVVIEYNGDIFQVMLDCEDDPNCTAEYAFVIPDEGANLWVDNLVIPEGAQNRRLAEAFIDYVLHPQVGADISNYIAFGSPNQAAIDAGLIDDYLLESPIIYPPDEQFERLYLVEALVDNPDAQQYYNDAWDELKILIGR